MYNLIELKEAGESLKNKIQPGSRLMARSPIIPYYSGCEYKVIPWGDFQSIIKYAKFHKIKYLAVSERFIPLRKNLYFLLNPDEVRFPFLKLILNYRSHKNNLRVIVYEILFDKNTKFEKELYYYNIPVNPFNKRQILRFGR